MGPEKKSGNGRSARAAPSPPCRHVTQPPPAPALSSPARLHIGAALAEPRHKMEVTARGARRHRPRRGRKRGRSCRAAWSWSGLDSARAFRREGAEGVELLAAICYGAPCSSRGRRLLVAFLPRSGPALACDTPRCSVMAARAGRERERERRRFRCAAPRAAAAISQRSGAWVRGARPSCPGRAVGSGALRSSPGETKTPESVFGQQ